MKEGEKPVKACSNDSKLVFPTPIKSFASLGGGESTKKNVNFLLNTPQSHARKVTSPLPKTNTDLSKKIYSDVVHGRSSLVYPPRPNYDYTSPSVTRKSESFKQTVLLKDPRSVRDKVYQMACIGRVYDFLLTHSYPNPVSTRLLSSPSSKDFQLIFRFLCTEIDAKFEFSKKFEDDVAAFLRAMRYPFASDINKSQLNSAGSIHTWPTLLAMLAWLVDLIRCSKCDLVLEEEKERSIYTLFNKYLEKSYQQFLSGEDCFTVNLVEFENGVNEKISGAVHEKQELAGAVAKLQEDVERCESTIKEIKGIEENCELMKSDLKKFNRFNDALREKKEKMGQAIGSEAGQIGELEVESRVLCENRDALKGKLMAHDLSIESIGQLNKEKEHIRTRIEETVLKTRELERKNGEFVEFERQMMENTKMQVEHLNADLCQFYNNVLSIEFVCNVPKDSLLLITAYRQDVEKKLKELLRCIDAFQDVLDRRYSEMRNENLGLLQDLDTHSVSLEREKATSCSLEKEIDVLQSLALQSKQALDTAQTTLADEETRIEQKIQTIYSRQTTSKASIDTSALDAEFEYTLLLKKIQCQKDAAAPKLQAFLHTLDKLHLNAQPTNPTRLLS